MASPQLYTVPVSTFSPSPGVQLSPAVLKTMLNSLETPLIVKYQIQQWMDAQSWKATDLCNLLSKDGNKTAFKICPREGSDYWKESFKKTDVIFETQCEYVEATFSDFAEWLTESNQSTAEPSLKKMKISTSTEVEEEPVEIPSNPLLRYSSNEYWVYADYKYMCNVCTDHPEVLGAVNWSLFGLDSSDGKNSTLWIGSEGSFTPCHYDTYGSNIVAQLAGTKKWTLFSPSDCDYLYPTRVPYEESSVFSRVNVVNPDTDQHLLFMQATAYTAVLEPGDVLYVPKHWWHFVQSMGPEPTVSINMWIKQKNFEYERVKEAVTRTLVSQFCKSLPEPEETPTWINPNEVIFSTDENLSLLSTMLSERVHQMASTSAASNELMSSNETPCDDTHAAECAKTPTTSECVKIDCSVQDFVKAVTSEQVITLVADALLIKDSTV